MRLEQLKSVKEFKLSNARVEFVTEDRSIKEIIIYPDDRTESYSIRPTDGYSNSVRVFRRLNYETKEMFRLKGRLLGRDFREDFDERSQAEEHKNKLLGADPKAVFVIEPITVNVDESGVVLDDAGRSTDIPF